MLIGISAMMVERRESPSRISAGSVGWLTRLCHHASSMDDSDTRLPTEILSEVLGYCPKSILLVASTTSHALQREAERLLYHSITLSSAPKILSLTDSLSSCPRRAQRVHGIAISLIGICETRLVDTTECLRALKRTFPLLINLHAYKIDLPGSLATYISTLPPSLAELKCAFDVDESLIASWRRLPGLRRLTIQHPRNFDEHNELLSTHPCKLFAASNLCLPNLETVIAPFGCASFLAAGRPVRNIVAKDVLRQQDVPDALGRVCETTTRLTYFQFELLRDGLQSLRRLSEAHPALAALCLVDQCKGPAVRRYFHFALPSTKEH